MVSPLGTRFHECTLKARKVYTKIFKTRYPFKKYELIFPTNFRNVGDASKVLYNIALAKFLTVRVDYTPLAV